MRYAPSATGILVLLLLFIPGSPIMADDTVDLDALGPQVGEEAPGFTLPDQSGREHTLSSLLGPNGLVLVFFRSADW